jgi:hypothetical protein
MNNIFQINWIILLTLCILLSNCSNTSYNNKPLNNLNKTSSCVTDSGFVKFSKVGSWAYGPCRVVESFILKNDTIIVYGAGAMLTIGQYSNKSFKYISSFDCCGIIEDIKFKDNIIYIAAKYKGVVIVDIKDIYSPLVIGNYLTKNKATKIALKDHYAFISVASEPIELIDVSDPSLPRKLNCNICKYGSNGLEICDNYLFVCDELFKIFEISNPEQPELTGYLDQVSSTQAVAINDNYAFLTCGVNGLQIVNIEDISKPFLCGSYKLADNSPGSEFSFNVLINRGRAFLCNGGQELLVLNIENPANPARLGEYNIFSSINAQSYGYDVSVLNSVAILACGKAGLKFLDITNLDNITCFKTDSTPELCSNIAIKENYAFVCTGTSGLYIIDIADPTKPVVVSKYKTTTMFKDVFIEDDKAYLNEWSEGISIIDITNPRLPEKTYQSKMFGWSNGIAAKNNFIYVADGMNELITNKIINKELFPVDTFKTKGFTYDISISGSQLLLAEEYNTYLFNILSNGRLKLTHKFNVGSTNACIINDPNLIVLGRRRMGFFICGVRNDSTMVNISTIQTSSYTNGIDYKNNRLYLSDESGGINFYDIGNKCN